MTTPLLTTLALLALIPFSHAKPTDVDQAYEQGRWRLDIRRDPFRHDVRCRITDDYGHFPRVIAERGALVLKLPGHADGSAAWFSVDGAQARPWRGVEAALIANGAMAQAEALDNGTDGQLPLPYTLVRGARVIAVQSRRNAPVAVYRLGELWDLVASAGRLECQFQMTDTGR